MDEQLQACNQFRKSSIFSCLNSDHRRQAPCSFRMHGHAVMHSCALRLGQQTVGFWEAAKLRMQNQCSRICNLMDVTSNSFYNWLASAYWLCSKAKRWFDCLCSKWVLCLGNFVFACPGLSVQQGDHFTWLVTSMRCFYVWIYTLP